MKIHFSALFFAGLVLLAASTTLAEPAPQDSIQINSSAKGKHFRLYTSPIIAGAIAAFMAPSGAVNSAYYESIIQKNDIDLNSPMSVLGMALWSAGYSYLFLHLTGAKSKTKSATLGANLLVAIVAMSWTYFDPNIPLVEDQVDKDLFRLGTLALTAGVLTTGAVAIGARLDEQDFE